MSENLTPSNKHLLEFIKLYRNEPCLWQVKSKDYSNKHLKQISYEKLIMKWREVDPLATKDVIVKKINSLRTCFRKELKKVNASLKSGFGADDVRVYCPSLWYYNHLLFLRDLETSRESFSNIKLEKLSGQEREDTHEENFVFEEEAEEFEENEELCISSLAIPSASNARPSSSSSKTLTGQKRKEKTPEENLVSLAVAKLAKTIDEDEYDSVGKNIAAKLRKLPGDQRIIAEKLISDVLYESQLGNLTQNSVVLADPQWS